MVIQQKPLNVIFLDQTKSDNINLMIAITDGFYFVIYSKWDVEMWSRLLTCTNYHFISQISKLIKSFRNLVFKHFIINFQVFKSRKYSLHDRGGQELEFAGMVLRRRLHRVIHSLPLQPPHLRRVQSGLPTSLR